MATRSASTSWTTGRRVVERAPPPDPLRLRLRCGEPVKGVGKSFVAESAPMRRLLADVARVAPKDVTVLVRGETGTGKELIASMVHAQGRRANGPLVRFNCARDRRRSSRRPSCSATRAARSPARRRPGAASSRRPTGGRSSSTRSASCPVRLQPKLLRVLQEGEIQPVGSARVEKVDVRVVASTNRDLEAEVRAGRFREDLYYRLAVVELVVPPLREHRDDVPALANEFTRRYATRFRMDGVTLSPAVVEKLREADWPGNVRQLENAVARMVALGAGGEIGPDAFAEPPPRRPTIAPDEVDGANLEAPVEEDGGSLRGQLDALERALIITTLVATGGNQTETARRLGVGRTTLFERMRKYGLRASRGGEHGTPSPS